MAKNHLIRDGKGTAAAQRVRTTPPALQIGDDGTTWYTGTLNVDISEDEDVPPILNVVDDSVSGTLSYVYRQVLSMGVYDQFYVDIDSWSGFYGDGLGGWTHISEVEFFDALPDIDNVTARHYLRLFSVRKPIRKIYENPTGYEVWADNVLAALVTVSLTEIEWWAPAGEPLSTPSGGYLPSRYFKFRISGFYDDAGVFQPSSFGVESRASVYPAFTPPDRFALRIKEVKTGQFILRAVVTFTPTKAYIEYVNGVQAMKTFSFLTYEGKAASKFTGSVMELSRMKQSAFKAYLEGLAA